MKLYNVYGLRVLSALDLCATPLPAQSYAADVQIQMGAPIPPPSVACAQFLENGFVFEWPIAGRFEFDGVNILIRPAKGVSDDFLQIPILGSVMSLVIHYRGQLVLHASVLDVGGRAAVFMGDKGAGKSTLAASLVRAGHDLLSDDVAALYMEHSPPLVAPGFAQVKLLEEAAHTHSLSAFGARAPLLPELGKEQWTLERNFQRSPLKVGAVFVLRRDTVGAIAPLEGSERFTAITRFGYAPRFGAGALQGERAKRYFSHCAKLANSAPVATLFVPNSLGDLPMAQGLIETFMQERP